MAECRGLAPHARRHALVSTEARFACPVRISGGKGVLEWRGVGGEGAAKPLWQPINPNNPLLQHSIRGNWSVWQDLHLHFRRFELRASAMGSTRLARRAQAQSEGWCPRSDLHRHFACFKCAVSALDYVGIPELG